MSTRILVDSTTDMNPEVQNQVMVVPLTIHFGEEEYIDGVNITGQEFYEKLVESEVLPTTSQASPFAFQKAFREAVEAGDTVVALTLSASLSGTYQSACIAAEDFPGKVYVVDTHSVTIGAAILAEYALRLVAQGMSAEALAEKLTQKREEIRVIAMLDTLEYLKRGGRISKAAAVAGSLLSIKPVVTLRDGEIKVLGKARGSRQANNMLVQEINKAGGVDFEMPLLLGYTGLNDALLQKYIHDSEALWHGHADSLHSTLVGSVVGTHTGPGAVAVAFFAENENECRNL